MAGRKTTKSQGLRAGYCRPLPSLPMAILVPWGTLESTPWHSADGKIHSRQALIIQIDTHKMSLFASQLYEDEISVLEYACPSLRSFF